MLYTLKLHKTQNILYVRPKQACIKPFALTFQKPIDAALLYSEINERRFKTYLENKTKLVFDINQDQFNPNFQLDNWCTQVDRHMLEYSARLLNHDVFITDDIIIKDRVVLQGYIYEIQSDN